jgi:hypothetical protein
MKQRYCEVSLSGLSKLSDRKALSFQIAHPVQVRVLAFRLQTSHPVMALTQSHLILRLEIMKNSHLDNTLDLLPSQFLNFDPQATLASQTPQYKDASLNEILDLLESAVETYTAIAPTLSPRLRESAEQEIDFFYSLTQKRLGSLNDRLIQRHEYQVAA